MSDPPQQTEQLQQTVQGKPPHAIAVGAPPNQQALQTSASDPKPVQHTAKTGILPGGTVDRSSGATFSEGNPRFVEKKGLQPPHRLSPQQTGGRRQGGRRGQLGNARSSNQPPPPPIGQPATFLSSTTRATTQPASITSQCGGNRSGRYMALGPMCRSTASQPTDLCCSTIGAHGIQHPSYDAQVLAGLQEMHVQHDTAVPLLDAPRRQCLLQPIAARRPASPHAQPTWPYQPFMAPAFQHLGTPTSMPQTVRVQAHPIAHNHCSHNHRLHAQLVQHPPHTPLYTWSHGLRRPNVFSHPNQGTHSNVRLSHPN